MEAMVYISLNLLFLIETSLGIVGISRSRLPLSKAFSILWAAWIMINYLYLIRIRLCKHCFYYGKRCPLGWGLIIPRLCSMGDLGMFNRVKWPILYLFSYTLLPPVVIIPSLIYSWDLYLLWILILFLALGLSIFLLARGLCCAHCKMESMCILSKRSNLLHNLNRSN